MVFDVRENDIWKINALFNNEQPLLIRLVKEYIPINRSINNPLKIYTLKFIYKKYNEMNKPLSIMLTIVKDDIYENVTLRLRKKHLREVLNASLKKWVINSLQRYYEPGGKLAPKEFSKTY